MRPADKHLTPQELDLLLLNPADSRDSNATGALPPEAQQHLNGCLYCQSVAEKRRKAEEALRNLRIWSRTSGGGKALAPGSGCPPEDTWSTLAAGLMRDEEAAPFITHAATCGWCGPRLKEAMHDLADDITAEEQEALAKLPSASPGWQRAMAEKLAAQQRRQEDPQPDPKPAFRWWPKLAWAIALPAVAIIAVGVGWLVWLKTREPDVNALLAQAYTEQRTIELRMPGAKYGPMRVERGPQARDLPQQFYSAQTIIKTELAKHPEDPAWLQAQAKAHLLEWDYENAIRELDHALRKKPDDPGLLLDKATALFQQVKQAKAAGSPADIDYSQAVQLLSTVLKKKPDNFVALFNRAIIYEEMHLPKDAIEDLNRYLTIDSTSEWANDARERLERLQRQLQTHLEALATPLADPATFMRLANDPHSVNRLEQRIEDYQEIAITDWLPSAFSSDMNASAARKEQLEALHALGDLLATRHRDTWLSELLPVIHVPSSALAIKSLQKAVTSSNGGDAAGEYQAATEALHLFRSMSNSAGVARSQVEQVHARQRAQKGNDCLDKGKEAAATLNHNSYRWLRAQLEIDEGACSMMVGKFDQARAFIAAANKDIDAGHYPFLQLRSMGIGASIETDAGNLVASWAMNEQGLAKFWEIDFAPAIRAQQFYDDLVYAAEALQQWNVALALGKESANAISLTSNRTTEIAVRQHLAEIAVRAGDFDVATEQLQQSKSLLGDLPSSEGFAVYGEIIHAEIDLQEGRLKEAEARLAEAEPKFQEISSFTLPLSFYQIYGEVLRSDHRTNEAEAALRRAIAIAEANLHTIKTPVARDFWIHETGEAYRSLVSLELAKENKEEALAVWEWYLSAPLRRSLTSVPDFGSSLGSLFLHKAISNLSDETVVSYALVPEGLAVWVFDDHGINFELINRSPSQISSLVHRFASMCAEPNSDLAHLRAIGRDLYDLFILPIAGRLNPSRTLVVEIDPRIADLPLQAMMGPDDRYLIEDFAVDYSPGILYQAQLRPSAVISANARALVVGSTANVLGPGRSFLTVNGVQEAEEIAKKFEHPLLLTAEKATVENLESLLPDSEVFHFAGHAFSDSISGGLVMRSSNGSRKTEIWGGGQAAQGLSALRPDLFRRSQLVVLAACSTGKSHYERREIHGELVRTLLAARVPHIVATSWDVDSEATEHFMNSLYGALLSGKHVPAALQTAAIDLKSIFDTQHPYYWAAFAAFGRS